MSLAIDAPNDALVADSQRACDKRFTLLCIDDEVANLKVLASIFDDCRLILCKTVAQGYDKALQSEPDVILLDVLMPGESGFEAIERFKSCPQLSHIPVIFITGLQGRDEEEKGLLLGACDYIHKPFRHNIVRARVSTHLEIVRQRKLLERFANFDSLTELPNRRKWQLDSAEIWQRAQHQQDHLVMGIFDIDCFKGYNDYYGHHQGDVVLRRVANAVNRLLFEYRGRAYRCGGEEFFFYISAALSASDCEAVLAECLQAVAMLAIEHQRSTAADHVTVSVGAVRLQPQPAGSVEQTMQQADAELYRVKNDRRNDYALLDLGG